VDEKEALAEKGGVDAVNEMLSMSWHSPTTFTPTPQKQRGAPCNAYASEAQNDRGARLQKAFMSSNPPVCLDSRSVCLMALARKTRLFGLIQERPE
jgi:hypothetical protein